MVPHKGTMFRGRRHTSLPQSLPSARAELSSPGTTETETRFTPGSGENREGNSASHPYSFPGQSGARTGAETRSHV